MAAASRQWHVLGGGALGCLWSARMTRAGQKVSLILKNQSWEEMASPMTAKINVSNHFNLRCQGWQADIALEPVAASTAIRRLLVTTKCRDVCGALAEVVDRLTEDAIVVLLCNGMGVHDEVMSNTQLAGFSYLLAVTTHGAFTTRRFHCVHAGFGQTFLGIPQNSTLSPAEAASTATWLDRSGLNVSMEHEIERILWEKLAMNASINGLTALLECRNGVIIETSHGRSLVEMLCSEVGHVMTASKVIAPTDLLSKVQRVIHENAHNFSSMHQDIAFGQLTEIDYINGFVVTKGLLLQVPTPANRIIYDLIKMKEGNRL